MMVMDDRARRAQLLQLAGKDATEIARLLGQPLPTVQEWLSLPLPNVSDDWKPPNRYEAMDEATRHAEEQKVAEMALSRSHFLHIAIGEDLDGDADLGIGFWGPVAIVFAHLVDVTLEYVRSLPGVTRAELEDREFIAIYGTVSDPAGLESTLTAWWRERLLGSAGKGSI